MLVIDELSFHLLLSLIDDTEIQKKTIIVICNHRDEFDFVIFVETLTEELRLVMICQKLGGELGLVMSCRNIGIQNFNSHTVLHEQVDSLFFFFNSKNQNCIRYRPIICFDTISRLMEKR